MDALTIAEIRIGGFTFPPRDTTTCAGQLLNISQYQAVFALVSITYGGDARVSFGVPDLRGRFPLGAVGQGPGLPYYTMGQRGGSFHNVLSPDNLAEHTHNAIFTPTSSTPFTADVTVKAHTGKGDSNDAGGKYWATGEAKDGFSAYPIESGYSSTSNTIMATDAVKVDVFGGGVSGVVDVQTTGKNTSFSIQNPFLGINYLFALNGYFPQRQ